MATTRAFTPSVRGRARWPLAALLTGFLGVLPAPASAITAFGLSNANQIVTVDTNTPSTALSVVVITGLESGETALGIDVRPATGQLYLLGSSSRIYVNRLRVVSDTGENLRLDPDTGAVAAADGPLNPGPPRVVGSAYTNNVAGATATTLYAIDSATDQLLIQSPPNAGTLVPVGPLGVDAGDDVGFDITANDGLAFATLIRVAGVQRRTRIRGRDAAFDQLAPGRGRHRQLLHHVRAPLQPQRDASHRHHDLLP
jgi:hypothetical protein